MKRTKHKKALSAALIGAAVLSVGTVGFSAWVITGAINDQDTGNIGISVATVKDPSASFSTPTWHNPKTAAERATIIDNNGSPDAGKWTNPGTGVYYTLVDSTGANAKAQVCFGPAIGDSTGKITASGDGINDLEQLYFGFDFTLTATSMNWSELVLSMSMAYSFGGSLETNLKAAASAGHIVNPFKTENGSGNVQEVNLLSSQPMTSTANASIPNVSTGNNQVALSCTAINGKVATFSIKVWWNWGSNYTGNNPSNHTNQSNDAAAASFSSLVSAINALSSQMATGEAGDLTITLKATATVAV